MTNPSGTITALGVAFPRQIRTNDWWEERYPELIANAREATLAKVWADFEDTQPSHYDRAIARYLADPFRGTVERRVMPPDMRAQDLERAADGTPALRRGVAPERRISIEDPAMRHGRKSRSQRVDGYKRHVLQDLDSGVVRAVGVTPANQPEASVTDALLVDLAAQRAVLAELHIDRAYLSSPLVRARQTAEAIAAAYSSRPAIVAVESLAPGGSYQAVVTDLEKQARRSRIALVGHEPGVGELAARLAGSRHPFEFKKGAVCRIDLETIPPAGPGTLRWFMTPRQLRSVRT